MIYKKGSFQAICLKTDGSGLVIRDITKVREYDLILCIKFYDSMVYGIGKLNYGKTQQKPKSLLYLIDASLEKRIKKYHSIKWYDAVADFNKEELKPQLKQIVFILLKNYKEYNRLSDTLSTTDRTLNIKPLKKMSVLEWENTVCKKAIGEDMADPCTNEPCQDNCPLSLNTNENKWMGKRVNLQCPKGRLEIWDNQRRLMNKGNLHWFSSVEKPCSIN